MVNEVDTELGSERRTRTRGGDAEHAPALGSAKLNPFGDLHTLQHLSARLAKRLRGAFEPIAHRPGRCWAEPLTVERFADYLAERPSTLTAWLPMAVTPGSGNALLALDGKFVLELLDLFFGGTGDAPHPMATEFSPAAETLVRRIGDALAPELAAAWEPVSRLTFQPLALEVNPTMLASLDPEEAVIVTRFGLAIGDAKPVFVDIVYPVAALKPHAPQINARVHGKSAEADPRWRNGLTRAVMAVKLPIRSVLAEPTLSLGRLLELKEGDVIPIAIQPQVEVMVAANRLGSGVVGTSNGRAAIRMAQLERFTEEDFQ